MSDMSAFFGDVARGNWNRDNVSIFTRQQAVGATAEFQVWTKPRGTTLVMVVMIGAGGGGGGGLTGISGGSRGGAGGGGSGGRVRAIAPAAWVPDRLYVSVGAGGLASTGNAVAGGTADNTYLAPYPNNGSTVLMFTAGGGQGGGPGTSGGSASGGTAGSTTLGTSMGAGPWLYVADSGIVGGAGGLGTGNNPGASVTAGGSAAGTTAGAGGAAVSTTSALGGGITSPLAAWFPSVAGAASGVKGTDGYWSWGPEFVGGLGGCGGGSANAAAGGAGGNGAYGGGGGGGAGGTTGGAGGTGGDGLVIVITL